jgi:drug/metabolite transporter (DMT)-like permease
MSALLDCRWNMMVSGILLKRGRMIHPHSMLWPGAAFAIGSAALFGASTPLAKLLLGGGVEPWLLAGLLYLGSGVGLAAWFAMRRISGRVAPEAPLQRSDLR